jgi:UDP-N-acetylglucosamine 2-epimerase (non-hydrolysing)
MQPLRVLSIVGTRPEAIKMAPVIRELKRHENVDSFVCVTAQHREMLDQVLQLFNIIPEHDLNIMRPNQSLNQLIARIASDLEPLLNSVRPDWILVQGDTTTVMTAAIVARHLRIKIGHVEAGLRTGDMDNPFPEEMNRIIVDAISDLHFVPTSRALQNLLREGIQNDSITVTGNTVVDSLFAVARLPWEPMEGHPLFMLFNNGRRIPSSSKLVLITMHRRENFGRPLQDICLALKTVAQESQTPVHFVYPVHLNPNVYEPVHKLLGDDPHFSLVPPLDYLSLVNLMKRSFLIITDSGGIQEEAPSLGIPVLVLRKVTERPEGVEAGTVRLVGVEPASIVEQTLRLLSDPDEYQAMAQAVNPYGDGHAAERIVERLVKEMDRPTKSLPRA